MSKFTRNDLMELIAWAHAVGANKGKDFGSSHQELMCNILLLDVEIIMQEIAHIKHNRRFLNMAEIVYAIFLVVGIFTHSDDMYAIIQVTQILLMLDLIYRGHVKSYLKNIKQHIVYKLAIIHHYGQLDTQCNDELRERFNTLCEYYYNLLKL